MWPFPSTRRRPSPRHLGSSRMPAPMPANPSGFLPSSETLCLEGHYEVVEREDHIGPHELVGIGHQAHRCAPGRKANGMTGKVHRTFGPLDLGDALTAH